MKFINSFVKVFYRSIGTYFDIARLCIYSRNELSVPILKFSIASFFATVINTVTMFLPLKLLFVLSGSKSIAELDIFKDKVGINVYVAIIISLLFILYICNFLFTRWFEKGQIKAIFEIGELKGKFYPLGIRAGHKALKATSDTSIKICADILFLLFVSVVMFVISIEYLIFYWFLFIVFNFLIEYFVFTDNKYKFLDKVSLSKPSIIGFFAILMYYFYFIFIVVLQLIGEIGFFEAIVLLILSKVSNSAFKSLINKTYFLRSKFKHIMTHGLNL